MSEQEGDKSESSPRERNLRSKSSSNKQLSKLTNGCSPRRRRPPIKHHPVRREVASDASRLGLRRAIDYTVLDEVGFGGFASRGKVPAEEDKTSESGSLHSVTSASSSGVVPSAKKFASLRKGSKASLLQHHGGSSASLQLGAAGMRVPTVPKKLPKVKKSLKQLIF